MYLGIKGAMEILKVLDNKLNLNVNMKRLNEEVKEIEEDLFYRTEQISEISKQTALKKLRSKFGEGVDYIG